MITDKLVRDNIKQFRIPVTMPGGYRFDHAKTLQRIDLYYNGKFETGEFDSNGFKKYFYDYINYRCETASKLVDIDTKDIVLISENAEDELRMWLMEKDLKLWLKETEFGVLLNEIVRDYPLYGSVVIKKDEKEKKWCKINIQNLRMDTSAGSLKESGFVYEVHPMRRHEIQQMGWDKESIEELLERSDDKIIDVYECYDANEDGGWDFTIRADFERLKSNQNYSIETKLGDNSEYLPGVILYEDVVDELPYREIHWDKVPGRWLGIGFAERLFDDQIRINELENLKARGLHLTTLKLYQTRDETVAKNIFTDVENGDILRVPNGEITPLANEERNLSVFSQTEQRWDTNADRKTFTYDAMRGEKSPGSTTLGEVQILATLSVSFFELKREKLGLFLRSLFLDDILPSFKRQSRKSHVLKFASTDKQVERLRRAVAESHINDAIQKYVDRYSRIPNQIEVDEERERIVREIEKNGDLYFDVTEGFYDDLKPKVDIVITGEQIDMGAKTQTLQTAMQIIGSNPTVLQNRGTRAMFFKLMELTGISPVEFAEVQQAIENSPAEMPQGMPMAGVAAAPPSATSGSSEI